MPRMVAILYVCPRCGNYYGSSNAGDLQNQMNTDVKNAPTFSRSQCPDCRADGVEVDRLPHQIQVDIIGKDEYAEGERKQDIQVRSSSPPAES